MKKETLNRLSELQIENDVARGEMASESFRYESFKNRHENGTAPRAVSSFNLFQTPETIADRMASLLPDGCKTILEPSAGLGRLYKAMRAVGGCKITLIEESAACCAELYQLTADDSDAILKQADFLSVEPAREGNCSLIVKQLPEAFYDAVIMNPPFERGRDVKHIKHALKFLKRGGLLVGLCYNGVAQNRELKPLADSWEVLPSGSFKSEGTGADVVLLTIRNV